MTKLITLQKRTIEKQFPYTLEDLLDLIKDEIHSCVTKKMLIDFLFSNRLAKYQSGKPLGMICTIVVPYEKFYTDEESLVASQVGTHCGLVITHNRGYLNCYPRFDEYTYKLVENKFSSYLVSIGIDEEEQDGGYDPCDDEDIMERFGW